jgi:hypothetical protein
MPKVKTSLKQERKKRPSKLKHSKRWIGPARERRDVNIRPACHPHPQQRGIPLRRDYYGFYSNKSRGLRKNAGANDDIPALIESEVSSKEFRKNWARLIQKIYPVEFP